jgi:phage-related protein
MREYKATASRSASIRRITASFDRLAKEGLSSLNSTQYHLANQQHGIYEFIAGDLRVMFFKAASGKIVICTHIVVKDGKKASKPDVEHAVRCATQYKQAEIDGTLSWATSYNS